MDKLPLTPTLSPLSRGEGALYCRLPSFLQCDACGK